MSARFLSGLSAISVLAMSILAAGGCASTKSGDAAAAKSGPAVSTSASKALTAQDVVDRYRKAAFGKEGVRKQTSTTMKGVFSVEQFGVDGPFVGYARAPDSNVMNIEVMGMSISNGCFKGTCWAQQPGQGTQTLSGGAAEFALQQSDYALWEHLDRYYTSLEIVDAADGNPNHKIKAVRKNGDVDYFEFSKETGLLASAVFDAVTVQGRMKVPVKFSNYKEFGGVMFPTEVVQATPQATVKLTYSEITYEPVGDDKFAKPN